MNKLTPVEMLNELIASGYITLANVDPSGLLTPTAYVSVPSSLAFYTPPVSTNSKKGRAWFWLDWRIGSDAASIWRWWLLVIRLARQYCFLPHR